MDGRKEGIFIVAIVVHHLIRNGCFLVGTRPVSGLLEKGGDEMEDGKMDWRRYPCLKHIMAGWLCFFSGVV